MNLKDIEYMIKIAEKKNFSTAAKELYITQPALSQTIQKLENELNAKLFARKRNGVILTDAGRLFLQEAQTILYHLECLKRNMQNAGSLEVRTLRIGIAPLLSQFYFASPLIMYQKNILILNYPLLKTFSTSCLRNCLLKEWIYCSLRCRMRKVVLNLSQSSPKKFFLPYQRSIR